MKQLYLLRHGKAEVSGLDGSDWSRPLALKGHKDAQKMGRLLQQKNMNPDIIITSDAPRAETTAREIAAALDIDRQVVPLSRLYGAEPESFITILQEAAGHARENGTTLPPNGLRSVMIAGHNPGIQDFAESLTGESIPMGTCSLCILDIDIPAWEQISLESPVTGFQVIHK